MFSIYSSAFNLHSFSIDYKLILKNWVSFIGNDGEIVIAVNNPDGKDDSIEKLGEIQDKYPIIKLVESKISYSNNEFDGLLKNFALQKTSNKFPLKLHLDFDEILNPHSRGQWNEVGEKLLNSVYEAAFVPSIDLYGDKFKIRKNHNIAQKWRIHKRGLKRGVWREARLPGGLIDTTKSDTCEAITEWGDLVPTINIVPRDFLRPEMAWNLSDYLHTFHLGFLNLSRRADLSKNFWKKHWEDRSGHEENVITDLNILEEEPTIEHHLPLPDGL